MKYENQTVVFPMGMQLNASDKELDHTINNSIFKMRNRRDTLKMGNAIRIRKLEQDTTFENCVIYLEGTLSKYTIIPVAIHKCFVYGLPDEGMPAKIGTTHAHAELCKSRKGSNRYA